MPAEMVAGLARGRWQAGPWLGVGPRQEVMFPTWDLADFPNEAENDVGR